MIDISFRPTSSPVMLVAMIKKFILVLVSAAIMVTIWTYRCLHTHRQLDTSIDDVSASAIIGNERSTSAVVSSAAGDGRTRFGKTDYRQMLYDMTDREVDEIIGRFDVGGVDYLSPQAKRNFLFCGRPDTRTAPRHACGEVKFRRAGRKVALASFPGSGNTWARLLLEHTTGVFTGAVYCDKNLKELGLLGEYLTTGNVLAIKTHKSDPREKYYSDYDAVIYVTRNVHDAVKSEVNRKGTHRNHTGTLNANLGDDPKWEAFVKRKTMKYNKTVNYWLATSATMPVLVVRYEDLLTDLETQLWRMVGFLGHPVIKERLRCVVNGHDDTLRRKHPQDFDPFSPQQHRLFDLTMKSVEPIFNRYNISYGDLYHF